METGDIEFRWNFDGLAEDNEDNEQFVNIETTKGDEPYEDK